MYTQYTLDNELVLTINEKWKQKLLNAELRSKKPILKELLTKKVPLKSNNLFISHAQIMDNTILVKHKNKLEKRYWITRLGRDELFVKEELTKKNYLIKQNEFQDSIKQAKYIRVPEYVLKVEDPKHYTRITISKRIYAKPLSGSINNQKIRQIEMLVRKLTRAKLLPAILRPNHFLFQKNKFFLVDNSIGFPPINRNKIVLLEIIEKTKLKFDWESVKDIVLFEKQVNKLNLAIKKEIDLLRVKNLITEIKTGEKDSIDFEALITNKTKKLFSTYNLRPMKNKHKLTGKNHIVNLLRGITLNSILKQ
ncbi:MAG: hypothetical protein WC821_03625 [archaeon]|jgi:hypothetical protein